MNIKNLFNSHYQGVENEKINRLIKTYINATHKKNKVVLSLDRRLASKIYHNLGRLDESKIEKLCSNPELLVKLLDMSKVDCLKFLKENKI